MSSPDVTFFFENKRIRAKRGDSIAKALFDAGIRTLSYSVKYRRPRGVHCARGRCIMCHMEVDGVPGVPTCITPVTGGMRVQREDYRPFFAPFLTSAIRRLPFPAGFYYRMFTRPGFVRDMFLGTLRRMAGVGRVEQEVEEPVAGGSKRPTKRRVSLNQYHVIVVGAGLSGMSAALAAAEKGASVLLVDEYKHAGGHSIGYHANPEVASARDELAAKLSMQTSLEYSPDTTVLAFYPPNEILVGPGGAVSPSVGTEEDTGAGMSRVRAGAFVFATGAYDAVPLFDNNDTQGVFGPRAIRLLVDRDNLQPGSRAVVYGTGHDVRDMVAYLRHNNIDVVAVVDATVGASTGDIPAGVRTYTGARVTKAAGKPWISSVTIDDGNSRTKLDCDLLCTAFPGQGAYELAYQAGFRFVMSDNAMRECRVMRPDGQSLRGDDGVSCFVVGELAGQLTPDKKKAAGTEAGNHSTQSRQTAP